MCEHIFPARACQTRDHGFVGPHAILQNGGVGRLFDPATVLPGDVPNFPSLFPGGGVSETGLSKNLGTPAGTPAGQKKWTSSVGICAPTRFRSVLGGPPGPAPADLVAD